MYERQSYNHLGQDADDAPMQAAFAPSKTSSVASAAASGDVSATTTGGASGDPTAAYSDMPWLSTNAITTKDRKMMFAWWDDFGAWLKSKPELSAHAGDDAVVTVTKGGQPFAKYPDLDSYVQTYDKNPNEAVDKWLAAMARALPDEVVARGEAAVNPGWLKPISIRTGMQGIDLSSNWLYIVGGIVLVAAIGFFLWRRKS